MTTPPTQGREEAIERGARALMNETALKVHGYTYCCGITGLVLDAAYPQQTPYVDDAVHIAVDHGRRTVCGQAAQDRNTVGPTDPRPNGAEGCWMCLQIAGELAPALRPRAEEEANKLARECERLQRQLEKERGEAEVGL